MSPYTSEEIVTRRFVLEGKPRGLINIVDASNIERNLYLTMQLMELDVPMVLALNMMDEVRENGGSIRVNEMEAMLGVPVVPISAAKGEGIDELVSHALHVAHYQERPGRPDFCDPEGPQAAVHRCLHGIMHLIEDHAEKAGIPPRFAAISRIHGCDACRAGWLAEFPEEERARAAEAMQLFKDANRMLAQLDGDFHTHVRFGLYPACSDGDDLLLTDPEQEGRTLRLALLRQQHTTKPDEPYLCLSDFVRPLSQGISDTVGVFAATVDADMEHLYETGAYADDFKHLLAQTLSDRLAEASTEKMHQEVRTTYWGYAKDEQWSIEDLLVEKFTGIRPAVGYPSLPDQSVNFVLSEWLGFPEIGIRLTENGAMVPHASVSGLILSHPSARYFAIGKIGEDQLEDYARRRGLPVETMRKFLAANL